VSSFRLTPAARNDLIEIWKYTAHFWSPEQAEKYLLEIETCLNLLADNPDLAGNRPEIREGCYSFPSGQHVIFFLKGESQIQIIGILHGRMDVDARLL
jgi:toxin ParE1/3/4